MAMISDFDLKTLVCDNGSFGPDEIQQISNAINDDFSQFGVLRDAVNELEISESLTPASATRLGVCYYLLGRFQRAIETLSNSDRGAVSYFYIGRSHFALGDYDQAVENYDIAATTGYNKGRCTLARVEAFRHKGDLPSALEALDTLDGAIMHEAEYAYQCGETQLADKGPSSIVVEWFERAMRADDTHAGALFGMAKENDRRGNDDIAMDLYRRSAKHFPSHVGALLNLGLLYEDHGQYDRAQQCYRRVLEVYPNHKKAALYMKDACASDDELFDLEAEKAQDRMSQVLNIPVSDFELSVRSRNCLARMGVDTLGDLARSTEQELLGSKNFGETSLIEIRDMLTSKGLALGQLAHENRPEREVDRSSLSPEEAAVYDRPISDLNLSVRARKCMVRLRMNTIGELLRKTPDELLESKNFGVTSLNEVREKLTTLGLKLRGD
jgi:DNA-directed RNA polymerase subunit alpha